MPKVTFVAADGSRHVVLAHPGESVMATAVRNGVPGIIGECGGNRSCATCHIYVDDAFTEAVGPPGDMEDDMLDLGVSDRRDNSRLACQVAMTDALDGLVVGTPKDQL